jgi:5-methylcytosine-specific restriction protein A
MKSPHWTRDEAILLLDLYYSLKEQTHLNKTAQMQQLSDTLNALPIHPLGTRPPEFRNLAGIDLKLGNLAAIDPEYGGAGNQNGSKMDQQVFDEFTDIREDLRQVAAQIRLIATDSVLSEKLSQIEYTDPDEEGVIEGAIVFKLHKLRERNKSIIAKKKREALLRTNTLVCEICDFDFQKFYGNLGVAFIECHHRYPLSSLKPGQKTRLEDLALVCANCHRMLHRHLETLSVEELRKILKYSRL